MAVTDVTLNLIVNVILIDRRKSSSGTPPLPVAPGLHAPGVTY
jgi:hypothetical protein